jgi:hypothetical protein
MASKKKKATAKTAAKFKDLKSKKNPKGGAFDAYLTAKRPSGKLAAWIE